MSSGYYLSPYIKFRWFSGYYFYFSVFSLHKTHPWSNDYLVKLTFSYKMDKLNVSNKSFNSYNEKLLYK